MPSKIHKPAQIYPIATDTILGRIASGDGEAAALSVAEVLAMLDVYTQAEVDALETTFTGDVTGSGSVTIAMTIAAGAVSLSKMADVATSTVFYRKTAGTGSPEVQTLSTLKDDLGLTSHITLVGTSDAAELDVRPYASQTNNQQVWRNTSGTVIASIDASGRPTFGTGTMSVTSAFNVVTWNGAKIGWGSGSSVNGTTSPDTALIRDGAAGAIAARNTTTAHVLRIYNTYTNSTVYERGVAGWVSNVFTIGSYASGGGSTLRGIMIGVTGNSIGFFGTTAIAQPTTAYSEATFVANSGTAVSDASTFDGYTVGQVVAALRGLGLLQ